MAALSKIDGVVTDNRHHFLLFGTHIPPEDIPRTGITELTKEDMAEAERNQQGQQEKIPCPAGLTNSKKSLRSSAAFRVRGGL